MTTLRFCDKSGTSAIEFAIIAPVLIALLVGLSETAIIVWIKFGLQNAVTMSARCASVSKLICGTTSATQTFASRQAYGLEVPGSAFSVSTASCGYQVTAKYTYRFITSFFGTPSVSLGARSCFPK